MRWILFGLGVILNFVSLAFAQTPELEQAIQVVRNWLNDSKAPVRFRWTSDTNFDLYGPRNIFVFEAPGYRTIDVDFNTMTIIGWVEAYTPQSGPSLLSDEQVKNIALNYVKDHFPHFNEFEHWEVELDKFWSKITGALKCRADVSPFFINDQGQKIPCLAIGCRVNIDLYTGEVYGFGYSYMPMNLRNLTPSFSASEAKTRIEQAFKDLGASQAVATMSSSEDIFPYFPDGLVIGATQTSRLRLAYAFDYVVTAGAPGHEDEFGDAEHPAMWRAAIDAHTGELFYREYWLGEAGEKEKQLLRQRRASENLRKATWVLPTVGVLIAVLTCLALVIFRRLRR